MTRSVSEIVEEYLSRLRGELVALDAEDTDELVLEIRSLLTEAAGDDPWTAEAEVDRLGEPAELAIGILAERGIEAAAGMSTGIWWRLGIAAPVDLALGAALPLVAVFPLYSVARFGQPRVASIAIAIALAVAVLAWPFLLWRPWRTGGRSRTPGMTLMGLAVVRAPGSWRLVRTDELKAMGLAPRRGVLRAFLVALVGVVLLAGASRVGLDVGGSWLASVAISAEFSGLTTRTDEPLEAQLQDVIEQVYAELAVSESPGTASSHVSEEASAEMRFLWEQIALTEIRSVRIATLKQIAPGVYRCEVREYEGESAATSGQVGSSTFTVGRRQWLLPDGVGSDWVVVGIEP